MNSKVIVRGCPIFLKCRLSPSVTIITFRNLFVCLRDRIFFYTGSIIKTNCWLQVYSLFCLSSNFCWYHYDRMFLCLVWWNSCLPQNPWRRPAYRCGSLRNLLFLPATEPCKHHRVKGPKRGNLNKNISFRYYVQFSHIFRQVLGHKVVLLHSLQNKQYLPI